MVQLQNTDMLIMYIYPTPTPYLPSGVEIMHSAFLRLLFVKPRLCTGGALPMLRNVPHSAVILLMMGEPLM